MFSASESVVKKHVISCVFLLFYLFIPLLLLANIIQENFREKTLSIETERGTKSCVPILKGGALVSSAPLAVLVYGLLCWFMACCVGLWLAVLVHLRQVHPLGNCCALNTKKRTKRTLLLNQ
mgnify:CR=1 FL=1